MNQVLRENHVFRALGLAVLCFSSAQAQEIDLLLKGGHVIDPKNQIDAKLDVAITRGRIYRVASNLSTLKAKNVIAPGQRPKLRKSVGRSTSP